MPKMQLRMDPKSRETKSLSRMQNQIEEIQQQVQFRREQKLNMPYAPLTHEELINLYITYKFSARQIAKIFKIGRKQLTDALIFYEIERRPSGGILGVPQTLGQPSKEELMDLYIRQQLSAFSISKQFNVSAGTIKNWLKVCNIPVRLPGGGFDIIGPPAPKPTKESIEQLYTIEDYTIFEVATAHSVSYETIIKYFKQFNIKRKRAGNLGKIYDCKHGHTVMSSYELKVDDWLYDHQIHHEYERKITSERKFKSDFYANGYYIEVWGIDNKESYEKRKQIKIALYESLGFKLIHLNVTDFRLGRQSINKWEHILESMLL